MKIEKGKKGRKRKERKKKEGQRGVFTSNISAWRQHICLRRLTF